jgi:omega-6 fatty acid desaturase (delta-12 desaturase)
VNKLGARLGIKVWGARQAFIHLIVGWPAYLLIGATGGPARGATNHFLPNPLTKPSMPKKELFPGNWKEKVLQSDIGIAVVVGALGAWTLCNGLPQVIALYGGPLIVINAWLVIYTWLQHTDVDVPHFDMDDHNFVKGAFHTIDRPYNKLDPWGFIDFLHHKIGTTHVAHHYDSSIPFYKADVATEAIKKNFPELYLYDPTPIPKALWRVCKGCTAAEKRGDKWIWNNAGLVNKL